MAWKRPQHLEIREPLAQGWLGGIFGAVSLELGGEGERLAVRLLRPELIPEIGRITQVMRFGIDAAGDAAGESGRAYVLPTSLPEAGEGQLFYTMPRAEAGSLRTLLVGQTGLDGQTGPDILLACDLTRQIAEALDAAHMTGTLHGNLKPENVLLWPRPATGPTAGSAESSAAGFHVRVSDFGLNSLRPPDARSPYLSPDIRLGAPASVQDDLYGLGTLLLELLTGRVPPLQATEALHWPEVLRLPGPLRKLLGRCFGQPMALPDVASFLGLLRAAQLSAGAQQARAEVQLFAHTGRLEVVPGVPQTLTLRVLWPAALAASPQVLPQMLTVEGWPAAWGTPPVTRLNLPAPPPSTAQPNALPTQAAELTTTLTLELPRQSDILPGLYDLQVVAQAAPVPGPSSRNQSNQVVARWPLQVEVQPFVWHDLRLDIPEMVTEAAGQAAGSLTGRQVPLRLTLHNAGNQPQPYRLEVMLPAGAQLRRGHPSRQLGRQLELAAGDRFVETLEVVLPAALWRPHQREVSVVAHTRTSLPSTTLSSTAEAWPPPVSDVQATARFWQRATLPWWSVAALALALGGLTLWAAQPPRIDQFAVRGETPLVGQPFTLTWQTSGARRVELLNAPSSPSLPASGERQMPGLAAAQSYTLVAQGWLTRRTRQLSVRPEPPAPSVTLFRITPASPKVGQTVIVQWEVSHADHVTLTPFGTVPNQGTRQIKVTPGLRFELRAQSQAQLQAQAELQAQAQLQAQQNTGASPPSGQHGAAVVSTIVPALVAPQIQTFSLSPAQVQAGQAVTLTWQTSGAARVRLAPLGDLPASGSRLYTPTQSGTLTLKASNGQQETALSRAVTVLPAAQPKAPPPVPATVTAAPPRITQFVVSPARPQVGTPLTVRWQTQGAPQVTLRWGNQQQVLPPGGQVTLTTTPEMSHLVLVAVPTTVTTEGTSGAASPVMQALEVPVQPAVQPAALKPASTPTLPAVPARPSASAPATKPSAPAQPSSTAKPPARPASPRIQQFVARPAHLAAGSRTTLSWKVSGVSGVTLFDPSMRLLGHFGPVGSLAVTAGGTGAQEYRLVAGSQVGHATLSVGTVPLAAPAAQIRLWRAHPAALRPGERATVSWQVTGVTRVWIAGQHGPNADGSFAPNGQLKTPPATATQVLTLSAGTLKKTLRIPLLGGAPSLPNQTSGQTNVGASRNDVTFPATFAALGGTWTHPDGQLTLEVTGNHVTGQLTSSRADLPGGTLRGRLSGDASQPVLNAFVTSGTTRTALLIRFDPAAQTFEGFYSSRAARVPWCGWKGGAAHSC